MKKYLVITLFIFLLLQGCGNKKDYKLYSESQKKKIINKMDNGDTKAKTLYEEITSKLFIAVENGDETALQELDRWESLNSENDFMKIDTKDYSKYRVKSIRD